MAKCLGTCPTSGRHSKTGRTSRSHNSGLRSSNSLSLSLSLCPWSMKGFGGNSSIDYQCLAESKKNRFRCSRRLLYAGILCSLIFAKHWIYWHNARQGVLLWNGQNVSCDWSLTVKLWTLTFIWISFADLEILIIICVGAQIHHDGEPQRVTTEHPTRWGINHYLWTHFWKK